MNFSFNYPFGLCAKANLSCAIVSLATLFGIAANGHGATMQAVSETFSFKSTNWTETVDLPLFDGSLGTLTGIIFELRADVGGGMSYESQDGSAQTITMTLGADLTVGAPSGLAGFSELATAQPQIQIIENASAYDGVLDFDGTSGSSFTDLSDSVTTITTYDESNPLWEFSLKDYFTTDTPGETAELPIAANGEGSGTGSGNLTLNFITGAGGQLIATYIYEPIPEPSSLALIGSALLLVGRSRRR